MPDHVLHNETELLRQVAAGDEQAFRIIFDHYWDHLYHYLVQVTKSPEIAEEIAGDVFVKLWTGREWLAGIRHLDGFLFRVAKNKAIDFLKLAARQEKLRDVVGKAMRQAQAPAADLPVLDQEVQQILNEVIAKLSPRRRLVFIMSRIEGFTNEEIATRLNLSRNTIKNTLGDSVRCIRSLLASRGIDGLILLVILHLL